MYKMIKYCGASKKSEWKESKADAVFCAFLELKQWGKVCQRVEVEDCRTGSKVLVLTHGSMEYVSDAPGGI